MDMLLYQCPSPAWQSPQTSSAYDIAHNSAEHTNSFLNMSFPQYRFRSLSTTFLDLWRTTNVKTWFSKLKAHTACNDFTSGSRYRTAKLLKSLWFAAWINLMDTYETVARITLIIHCQYRWPQKSSPTSKLPKENQPLKTLRNTEEQEIEYRTTRLYWGRNGGNSSVLFIQLLTKACLLHLRKIILKQQNSPFVARCAFDPREELPRKFHNLQNRAHNSNKTNFFRLMKRFPGTKCSLPQQQALSSALLPARHVLQSYFFFWKTKHTDPSRKHSVWNVMEEVGTLPLIMTIVSPKEELLHLFVFSLQEKEQQKERVSEIHPLMLPVHAAEIKSSISSVNKSTRADRFCWNNSWVTNRKQLVQPICRKIQRPCQRKSCWKQHFHPSQRIVSQIKVLLLSLP